MRYKAIGQGAHTSQALSLPALQALLLAPAQCQTLYEIDQCRTSETILKHMCAFSCIQAKIFLEKPET